MRAQPAQSSSSTSTRSPQGILASSSESAEASMCTGMPAFQTTSRVCTAAPVWPPSARLSSGCGGSGSAACSVASASSSSAGAKGWAGHLERGRGPFIRAPRPRWLPSRRRKATLSRPFSKSQLMWLICGPVSSSQSWPSSSGTGSGRTCTRSPFCAIATVFESLCGAHFTKTMLFATSNQWNSSPKSLTSGSSSPGGAGEGSCRTGGGGCTGAGAGGGGAGFGGSGNSSGLGHSDLSSGPRIRRPRRRCVASVSV
mmetsp:Transcript_107352/g.342009  ORF Transcript_107352/g.342009 Transcript_107352/m.342009 type:complete len:256 (+) Transcript_107352:876-1643(+)